MFCTQPPTFRIVARSRRCGWPARCSPIARTCIYSWSKTARLADPQLGAENPCRALFYELLDVGLDVQVCGSTMKKLGWDEAYSLPGIHRGSMKALSTLMSAADEIITF